jgi:hypothetical protein
MLASFCLRLAAGMLAALLLLPAGQVNPRFFRTHFLTALGLTAVAAVFLRDAATPWLWLALAGAVAGCFIGSMVWSLDGAPGGRVVNVAAVGFLGTAVALAGRGSPTDPGVAWQAADELTSTALLGTAMTAMLIGHSYLIAPTMSIAPLVRLLGALAVATILRLAVAGAGLWFWSESHSLTILSEVTIWLPVRWLLGFVGPLVLAGLAWQTAKIRSTQSATGILYVVVILCFLGELTGQLLRATTGYVL